MFIINVSYIKPIAEIDTHLESHRAFLDACYQHDYFIASGPKVPRSGGVILTKVKDKEFLQNLIKQDPFYIHNLAQYEFIEFKPNKGRNDLIEQQ